MAHFTILPPWYLSSSPNTPAFRSCESYFGNGFTRRVDVLTPEKGIRKMGHGGSGGGGWFRCFFSETLRSSICEGGGIRMHPDNIKMSNGGEVLETVIGRGEDEELPRFEFGAFDIQVGSVSKKNNKLADEAFLDMYLQNGAVSRHAMRDLVGSVKLVGADEFECSEVYLAKYREMEGEKTIGRQGEHDGSSGGGGGANPGGYNDGGGMYGGMQNNMVMGRTQHQMYNSNSGSYQQMSLGSPKGGLGRSGSFGGGSGGSSTVKPR